MYWITENLAFGGLTDIQFDDQFTAVLNLHEDHSYSLPETIHFYHNGFPDVQPFPLERIWECVQWIDQRISLGQRVLVHCAEGNSRSVSVVIAYLLYKGHGLDVAKKKILSLKPFCTQSGMPTDQPQYFQEEFLTQWLRYLTERHSF
ncbi:MAG: dual specificity protein phosphatase family protein [Candidatus Binatia bacterium]